MAESDISRAPPSTIEGVAIIDPKTLEDTDFSRFRGDHLYFIDFVTFYPAAPRSSTSEPVKPVERVLALTPHAFFVTELDGTMELATRYDSITEMYTQKKVTKRLFGSDTWLHLVIKIPREVDCHIAVETKEFTESKFHSLVDIFGKVWAHFQDAASDTADTTDADSGKKGKKKHQLPVHALESNGDDITTKVSKEAAEGYVPPEEMKRRAYEARMMRNRIESLDNEIFELQKQVEAQRTTAVAKQQELKAVEAKYGIDLSQLRSQKQLLLQRQSQLSKQVSNIEMEIGKQQGDVARLREQLEEERINYENLVEKQVADAGNQQDQKQHEMMQLRQKAQQKEVAKAGAKYQAVLDQLAQHPPQYSGVPALAKRAEELEVTINESLNAWNQQMLNGNKVKKFLDAVNAELSRVSALISDANDEKETLLKKREEFALSSAQPHSARPSFLDDDVLVTNTSVTALPASSRSILDDGDEDFLAAISRPTQPPHNATKGADPLDDLLGDEPTATVAPRPPVDLDDF